MFAALDALLTRLKEIRGDFYAMDLDNSPESCLVDSALHAAIFAVETAAKLAAIYRIGE